MAGWLAYTTRRDIFKINIAICWRERGVQLVCAASYDIILENDQTSKNKLAAAHTNIERGEFNITYKDRQTNIWVREQTNVIDISNVRKIKWSWAGHINRLKDDRWTSCVTTWKTYDTKWRQGRPAKRDDLDKYWSDTIWQRKAQDGLFPISFVLLLHSFRSRVTSCVTPTPIMSSLICWCHVFT